MRNVAPAEKASSPSIPAGRRHDISPGPEPRRPFGTTLLAASSGEVTRRKPSERGQKSSCSPGPCVPCPRGGGAARWLRDRAPERRRPPVSCVSSAPEEGRGRSGALTWLVLASILAVHLLVSTRSVAPSSLASPEPFYADDYALHVARAAIIAGQLPHTGRLWVYDPTLMAGYPLGATVFDLDNVGTAVLMALLEPLGPPVPFKLVVWLCLALAPVAVWLGARQLGTTSAEAVTAAAPATVVAASAITFRLGMFANFGACYLAILVVALANRYLA